MGAPAIYLGATAEREVTEDTKEILRKDFLGRDEAVSTFPPYVTGTTATYERPVFNPESPALLTVRQRIAAAIAGRASCEILVMGDSKSTPYQGEMSWPDQMRRMIGAADGFVQADDGSFDSRWTVVGMRLTTTRSYVGLIPITTGTTDVKSATFAATEAFTGGAILVSTLVSGDPVTLVVDGQASTVTTTAGSGWTLFDLGNLPDTPHTITVSSTAGNFNVSGVSLTYPEARLRISNPSRGGSNAAEWTVSSNPRQRWSTFITGNATSPDVIIGALGTNEPTNLAAITAYYDKLATLNIPVIIVSPGAIDGSRGVTVWHDLADHLYGIAEAHDWPLIDFSQVIGDFATANSHGLMLDNLHENTRGLAIQARAVKALVA